MKMKSILRGLLTSTCLAAGFFPLPESVAWAQPKAAKRVVAGKPVDAGDVLGSVFDVRRGSRLKQRGFMQRTFFDSIGPRDQPLQVAFVIDGTDSMGKDIRGVFDSLKSMVEDLRRNKDEPGKVSFSLVIYRDAKSPSGVIELPMGEAFTSNLEELQERIAAIKTESGEPYFEEAVDVGLYDAMKSLDWRSGANASRWVVVFGDAPPLHEKAPERNGVKRQHLTKDLVELAKETGTVVHCVLCSSGQLDPDSPNFSETYQKALPQTQAFMAEIAGGTGGVFLDLSNEAFIQQLVGESRSQKVEYQPLTTISVAEVDDTRRQTQEMRVSLGVPSSVRVAVLPHLPLAEMKFDAELPAVLVATQMRQKISQLPTFEVKDATQVQNAFVSLQSLQLTDSERLQKLATDLDVHYVIWGGYAATDGKVELKSGLYKRVSGEALADAVKSGSASEAVKKGDELGQNNLVQVVTQSLFENAKAKLQADGASDADIAAFTQVRDKSVAQDFSAPLAANLRASRELLSGMESLERALAFQLNAASYLTKAELKLKAAALLDPENPAIHSLLASVYYNQAGKDSSSDKAEAYKQSLTKAYENREQTKNAGLRTLIEAQYALIVEADAARAASLYESLLTESAKKPLDTTLQAHWMLAGIYSGDWNVSPTVIDPAKARNHVIAILANYPDSHEAQFMKQALRWDNQEGSEHPYFPREGDLVLSALSSSK